MVFSIVAGSIAGALALGGVYEQVSRRRERALPLPGKLVDAGGHRLHATDQGKGGPTVVVISGAGDCSDSWIKIRNDVAAFTRIVTYDRAGLGWSPAGPAPDAERSVAELRTLLANLGAPGPYVLVGHSLGGLLARFFALRHPELVCGLVFVDSTHERLRDDAKFKAGFNALGVMLKVMKAASYVGLPRVLGEALRVMPMYPERPFYARQLSAAEYAQWSKSVYRNMAGDAASAEFGSAFGLIEEAHRKLDAARAGPQFGDLPLAVLSNPGFGEGWTEMQRELSKRSTAGIHHVSDQKGHCVQMPRPDLVVDAIRHVVEQARRRLERAA